jgi:hypothetical protein
MTTSIEGYGGWLRLFIQQYLYVCVACKYGNYRQNILFSSILLLLKVLACNILYIIDDGNGVANRLIRNVGGGKALMYALYSEVLLICIPEIERIVKEGAAHSERICITLLNDVTRYGFFNNSGQEKRSNEENS